MKILNLHGYRGEAANSVFNAMIELGYDVISPQIDYDSITPKKLLKDMLELYDRNDCGAVVGTSAGGFFASQICVIKKCPVVLINPCLLSFVYLPRLGYNNQSGILEYMSMFSAVSGINKELVTVIVGEEDEIIDSHDFTKLLFPKCISVPNGKHSGPTLPLKDIFEQKQLLLDISNL